MKPFPGSRLHSGRKPQPDSFGWTLLQVLATVCLAAGFLAILIPGWMRSERREHADTIRGELRAIERAVAALAKDQGIGDGVEVSFDDYQPYLKNRKRLAKTGTDPLGNRYGAEIVGQRPSVSPKVRKALGEIVDDSFWEPYLPEKKLESSSSP